LGKAVRVDSVSGKETADCRLERTRLRLDGSRWRVTGRSFEDPGSRLPGWVTAVFADGREVLAADRGSVTVFVEAKKPAGGWRCPNCGARCKVHEYVTARYDHVPQGAQRCVLEVRLPKFSCDGCGGTPRLPFPAARKGVSYTKELEAEALRRCAAVNLSETARQLGISRDKVERILLNAVVSGMPEQDLSDLTEVYVDEIHLGTGIGYVTVFTDRQKRVVYMTRGKDADTVRRFAEYLVCSGGDPGNVWVACADMSKAFESGFLKYFRNATLVWDRFHLVKAVNDAVNSVRRRVVVRGRGEKLRGIRYVPLYRLGNMDPENLGKLEAIRLRYPELAEAFDLKETFCAIADSPDMYAAGEALDAWIEAASASGIPEMQREAGWFSAKRDRILAYFDHRVSNAVAEGVNSRIRITVNEARGFRNFANFCAAVMFRHGRLTVVVRGPSPVRHTQPGTRSAVFIRRPGGAGPRRTGTCLHVPASVRLGTPEAFREKYPSIRVGYPHPPQT